VKHPLVNVGFDIQFSGLQDCEFFADDIARFFNQGGNKLIPQNHLDTLKKDLPTLNNTFNITSNLQMCKTLMDIVANMISVQRQNKEYLVEKHSEFDSKYYRYKLLSLQKYLNYRYKFPDYDKDYAASSFARDHSMAENFRYIADELYPDEKIIVWAHNVHIMRNPDYIEEEEFIYRETMTHDLWQIYGDDIYNIAFVSYQGSVINDDDPAFAQISVCHPTQEGQLSWYLNQPGHEYGFLDIRGLDASHWLKNEKIYARFYAPKSYTANWYDICDAFVFIKTAKPVHIYAPVPAPAIQRNQRD
jgi:erythromycin esterase